MISARYKKQAMRQTSDKQLGNQWFMRLSVPMMAALLLATGFFGFAGGSIEASILLPDESPMDIERMLADTDSRRSASASAGASGASSSSNGSSRNLTTELPAGNNRDNAEQPIAAILSLTQTSTGGTTSGNSTSTSGSSGTSTFPIDSVATVSLSDAEFVAWVGSERRFTLPMPPGSELLRPPQMGLRRV